ncbi:hypothetical protein AB3X96_38840 [Paraburkholderia sp. BR13439]|uniref:hypothetical protein n=1 Tax=Paraburkholderia sp. BR13439 TaxID=3236996 RepID=UPI0034CDADDD
MSLKAFPFKFGPHVSNEHPAGGPAPLRANQKASSGKAQLSGKPQLAEVLGKLHQRLTPSNPSNASRSTSYGFWVRNHNGEIDVDVEHATAPYQTPCPPEDRALPPGNGPQRVRHVKAAVKGLAELVDNRAAPRPNLPAPLSPRSEMATSQNAALDALERAHIDEAACRAWVANLFGSDSSERIWRSLVQVARKQDHWHPYEQHVVLAQALHTACIGDGPAASKAAARLAECMPPRTERVTQAPRRSEIDAWHAAQLLSRSGIGRKLLERLAHLHAPHAVYSLGAASAPPRPGAALTQNNASAQAQRQCNAMRMYLQARDYLVEKTQADATASPDALIAQLDTLRVDPECALAVDALRAARKLFHQPSLHKVDLTDDERVAYFSWHQGYRSSAPGSDLAKVKARLGKSATWINRALQPSTLLQRLSRFIGKNKTPFDAMMRHGMGAAHLQWPAVERGYFDEAVAEAMSIAIDRLRERIRQTPSAIDLTQFAEALARLEYWRDESKNERFRTLQCDDDALASVRERALRIIDERAASRYPEDARDIARTMIERGSALKRDVFDLRMLENLAADTRLFQPADDIGNDTRDTFLQWVGTARGVQDAHHIDVQSRTVDGIKQATRLVIDKLMLGNYAAFVDGGVSGLDFGNFFINLLPLSAQPLITAMGGRVATFGISGEPPAGGLKFGSTRVLKIEGGCGAFGSLPFASTVISGYLGGELSARLAHNSSQYTGVIVRAVKQTPDNGEWREQLQRVNEFILDFAAEKNGRESRSPDALWSALAHQFFDEPGLSIGWIDERTDSPSVSATAWGGLKLGLSSILDGKLRAGPGGWLTGTFRPHDRARLRNTGGTHQIDIATDSRIGTITAGLGVSASPPSVTVGNGQGTIQSLSVAGVPVYSWSEETHRSDQTASLRVMFDEYGRVDHRNTHLDKEAADAQAHEKHIRGNWDVWTNGPDSAAALEAHLDEVRQASHHKNRNVGERWSLHPAAAQQLDAYAAAAEALHAEIAASADLRAPSVRTAKDKLRNIDERRAAVFADPKSWTPFCLFSYGWEYDNKPTVLPFPFFTATTTNGVVTTREFQIMPASKITEMNWPPGRGVDRAA